MANLPISDLPFSVKKWLRRPNACLFTTFFDPDYLRLSMIFKTFLGAAAALAIVSQASAADLGSKKPAPAPTPLPYFLFSDTQVSYSFYTAAKEPGINGPIQKHVLSVTHFDVTKWGTNFANIDFLKSNNFDPATGTGADGALEAYALYRGTLSGNYLAGAKTFSAGLLKDVSLAAGFDVNTKNTQFAPQKRLLVGGVQFAFDVPGYLNVSVLAGKEYSHCGLGSFCTTNPEFNTNAHIEVSYMQPLAFTGLPLSFGGYTNFVTPKGKDVFGFNTKLEILSDNRLTLDFGKVAFGKAKTIDTFVGYRYWLNKFGNDHKLPASGGAIENQIYVGAAFHI